MFAVIRTGGKQYRVAADDVITIEKVPGEAGEAVTFDDVLMVGEGENATIGSPLVAGASVAGEVVEQTRGRKLVIFKKKRRKHYRRHGGHRQDLSLVRITEILTDGAKPSARKAAAPKAQASETKADAAQAEPAVPAAEAKAGTAKAAAKPSAKAADKKPAAEGKKTTAKSARPAAKKKAGGDADTE